ncbi:oxidoreductase [Bradyrhizobium genosp. P]|uniref:oxidoreductase n=1 Tax=Bradyrhizobium genosp. P TaxID=83641 RepID=UPI003CF51F6A
MSRLDVNKVALVTGASSGIGEAVALRLAEGGSKVYAAARRLDRMEHLKEKGIRVLPLDLTDEASIADCHQTIVEETAGIDVLVNNAGYGNYGSIEEIPLNVARRQFEVNLFGLGRITQLAIPHMRSKRSGLIINVSSIGGIGAYPYGGWYHATKFALEGLSSSLRQELSPFDVDVVILRPGAIDTGWRAIVGESLLRYSGNGPYAKAVNAAHSKFMSSEFDKMVADPKVIADVVQEIVETKNPNPIYTAPRMARNLSLVHKLLGSDRVRDAFARRFIGLPKTM